MPNLVLIKHSLPEIVPGKPASQWKLSETGRQRCQILAGKLAPYSAEVVVSSVEPKAVETAQIVATRMHVPFHTVENLHEHERPCLDFSSQSQFEARVKTFFETPEKLVMGRETARQACERFSGAIQSLLQKYPNKNLALVAHGTVISLFVAQYIGLEPFSFWKELSLPGFVVFRLPQLELVKIVKNCFQLNRR